MKTVDRWYDRHTRTWVVQLIDEERNQIGPAIFVYSKSEALKVKEEDFLGDDR
jgi:hypothetical protein